MTDGNESSPKAVWQEPTLKAIWEEPALRRIDANDAEAGIIVGPEILILLS